MLMTLEFGSVRKHPTLPPLLPGVKRQKSEGKRHTHRDREREKSPKGLCAPQWRFADRWLFDAFAQLLCHFLFISGRHQSTGERTPGMYRNLEMHIDYPPPTPKKKTTPNQRLPFHTLRSSHIAFNASQIHSRQRQMCSLNTCKLERVEGRKGGGRCLLCVSVCPEALMNEVLDKNMQR